MPGIHEIDEKKVRSYELSVYSDKAAAQGDLDQAAELMRQAAALNRTYEIRAKFVGSADSRRVRVTATIRRLLLPPILDAGFSTHPDGPWAEGRVLQRTRGPFTHSLLLGRHKFGKSLGVMASRHSVDTGAAHFDWRHLNFRSGQLAYRTQAELESVCMTWLELLQTFVFPWFDAGAEGDV